MLHRAIFGSLERFFGILLEHHAGKLPAWLAPVQAVVMNITDRQDDYVSAGCGNPEKSGLSRREPTCGTKKSALRFASTRCSVCPIYWWQATRKWPRTWFQCVPERQGSGHDVPGDFADRLRVELEQPRAHVVGGLTYSYCKSKRIRRNEEITSPKVRVIGADGGQAGVMTRFEALRLAKSCGARSGRSVAEGGSAGRPRHGLRQIPVRTEQEVPRREAQAKAHSGQGNEVSSRYGRERLPDQSCVTSFAS